MIRIPNYEKYMLWPDGEVRNLTTGTILKPTVGTIGYPVVTLSRNGKRKVHYIHRLLAEAFLSQPEGTTEVNHRDGDKTNYKLTNLEWVSRSENEKHAFRTGLKKRTGGPDRRTKEIAWAI